MRYDQNHVREGMTVYSSEGEKLGKVKSRDASAFAVEKGLFFRKDYIARYDDVRSVDGEGIHLTISGEAFRDLRIDAGSGRSVPTSAIGSADYGFQPGAFTGGIVHDDQLSMTARQEATGEAGRDPAEVETGAMRRDWGLDEDRPARTSEPEEGDSRRMMEDSFANPLPPRDDT